jgi:hypothetical protein
LNRAAALALAAGLLACRRGPSEALLTAYHPEGGVSVQYPASWHTEVERRSGPSYRHFLAPPAGGERQSGVSVTLLAAPLEAGLDEYARTYLDGKTVASTRDEERQGAHGRSYRFASADGATRYSLLLLPEGRGVYVLYGQGPAAGFAARQAAIEAMEKSLTLERPAQYPEHRNDAFAFSVRVPPSWRQTRSFSGGTGSLTQFTSPALLADRNTQTVHAALTVAVEAAGSATSLEDFHEASRQRLGEAYKMLSQQSVGRALVDVMAVETPVAESRIKRVYRFADGRGYTLSCETREDAYTLVVRWCEAIAGTFKVGAEVGRP